EAIAVMKEGYDISARRGGMGFLEQFLFLMAGTSVHTGDWGAWIEEMDAIEEGEPLHPFYGVAFAQVRAMLSAARGDKREADAQLERSAAAERLLDSGMVTASEALHK